MRRVATIDTRTDIFALGLVLYEMLTGRPPFAPGLVRHYQQIIWPSRLRAGLPPTIDAILRRALAEDPAARYQTAEELAVALESVFTPPLHASTEKAPLHSRYRRVLTRLFSPFSPKP
jgi:serine/threonine protein kinase